MGREAAWPGGAGLCLGQQPGKGVGGWGRGQQRELERLGDGASQGAGPRAPCSPLASSFFCTPHHTWSSSYPSGAEASQTMPLVSGMV